jgi:hypothetical protein
MREINWNLIKFLFFGEMLVGKFCIKHGLRNNLAGDLNNDKDRDKINK